LASLQTLPLNNSKLAVLITFLKVIQAGKKHYATPRISHLLDLLGTYHKITIQKSWAYDIIHQMVQDGFLLRKRRWRHGGDGKFDGLPSMVSFTFLGLRYLVSKSIEGAREMLKALEEWYKKKDNRFPAPAQLEAAEAWLSPEENRERIKNLLKSLGVVKALT